MEPQATDDLISDLRSVLAADPSSDDPGAMIDVLVRHGALTAFIRPAEDRGYRYEPAWRDVLAFLSGLGGVDLSIARIFEGHLNALQLVALYGTPDQRRRILATVSDGGMLGVWGADAEEPVRRHLLEEGRWRLSGAKRYASGTGALRSAVVPVKEPDGTMSLLILRVDDAERVDRSTWNMRGMRRSVSGTYRFDGLVAGAGEHLGESDDYRREPYFVGGIWRCAAAQLGAVEAIVRHVVGELVRTGRDAHPLQMERIGAAITEARTARLWIEDAAARIEGGVAGGTPAEIETAVALSAYGRLVTERAAMVVIDLAERALGLGGFANGHPVEALSRDLAVYIRQANPDAVLIQHGRVLCRTYPS